MKEDSTTPDVLQYAELPVIGHAYCDGVFLYDPNAGRSLSFSELCAGYPGSGGGTCYGDSGGPLAQMHGSTLVQIGVTSWGGGCTTYSVFARVYAVKNWIDGIINP